MNRTHATSHTGAEQPSHALASDLTPLLRPSSIAIIGASTDPESISGTPQRVLAQHKYTGEVYPVNPRHDTINDLACYPDIRAVPAAVDVALIVINAERVATVLGDCGKAGVRFAVVISSGFAEQPDATGRQAQLEAVCAEYPDMRVLGPNSEGLINVTDAIPIGFSPTIDYTRGLQRLRNGNIAVIAHSGGLGFALFNDGLDRGLGFSHVISTGNEADLDLAELAHAVLADPSTNVLMLFIEGLNSPGDLAELAEAAHTRGKQLIIAKVGGSPAGHRAAVAHTAHHSGNDAEYATLMQQHGILRARDQEELVDLAMAYSRTSPPTGDRVGIVTTSGGAGTWMADAATEANLQVPPLSASLQTHLRERIPAYGSPTNPVDATAQVLGRGGIAPILATLADSGELDALILTATLADAKQIAREQSALAAIAARIPLLIYSYTRPAPASVDLLADLDIAYYTSSHRTARALRALIDPTYDNPPPVLAEANSAGSDGSASAEFTVFDHDQAPPQAGPPS